MADNPYYGPNPFPQGARLHGREDEIIDLQDILVAQRIVLLYSPSGAGKTSLIQAGLVKELRDKEKFRVVVVRGFAGIAALDKAFEGNKYVASVIDALDHMLPPRLRTTRPLDTLTLDQYLRDRPANESEGPLVSTELVLVFDQFEEILTLDPLDRVAKAEFFKQLGEALRDRSRLALFSMREDHIAGIDDFVHLLPTNLKTSYRLGLLDRKQARRAIVNPAAELGVDYEKENETDAADLLVNDLCSVYVQVEDTTEMRRGEFVEPVQLQVACHNLWETTKPEQKPERKITAAEVGKVSVDRALEEYYAKAMRDAAAAGRVPERDIREWVEDKLITARGIRAQVLSEPKQAGGLLQEAIRPLEDKAHLVRLESRGNRKWYELAHDRLIDPIRRNNATWFRTELSLVQFRTREFLADGRNDKHLLGFFEWIGGSRWAQSHCDEIRRDEQEFLLRSKRAVATRALTVILPFVLVAGFAGWQSYDLKTTVENKARIDLLQKDSNVKLSYARVELLSIRAPYQALRDAIEAAPAYVEVRNEHIAANHKVELDALEFPVHSGFVEALRRSQGVRAVFMAEPRASRAVAFSPIANTRTLVYGGSLGQVFLADLDSGVQRKVQECPRQPRPQNSLYSLAFSEDGTLLAAGCEDGSVVVWKTQGWTEVAKWEAHGGAVRVLAFAAGGDRVMSGGYDSRLRIKNLADSEPPVEFRFPGRSTPTGQIWSLAYSAASQTLFAGDGVANIARCDVATLQCVLAHRPPREARAPAETDAALGLVWSARDEQLIVAYWSGKIVRWDRDFSAPTLMRDPTRAWGGPSTGPVYSVAIAKVGDGAALLYYGADTRLQVEGIQGSVSEYVRSARIRTIGDDVMGLAVHSQGRLLAAATAGGPVVVIDTGGKVDWLTAEISLPERSGIAPASLAPAEVEREPYRGAVVERTATHTKALLAQRDTLTLVDIPNADPTRSVVLEQRNAGRAIARICASPAAKTAATLGRDGAVDIWEVGASLKQARPQQRCPSAKRIALTPKADVLVCAGDSSIEVLDLTGAGPRKHYDSTVKIAEMSLSDDGTLLAVGGPLAGSAADDAQAVELWDLQGTELRLHRPKPMVLSNLAERVYELGVSTVIPGATPQESERFVVAAGKNGYMNIWNAKSGELAWEIRAESRPVHQIAFDPARSRMASADDRGRIHLWDTKKSSGNREWTFVKLTAGTPNQRVGFLGFGADGQVLLSGGSNVSAWDLDASSLRRKACAIYGANDVNNKAFVPEDLFKACTQ